MRVFRRERREHRVGAQPLDVHERQCGNRLRGLRAALHIRRIGLPACPELQHAPAQRVIQLLPLVDRIAGVVRDVGAELVPVGLERRQQFRADDVGLCLDRGEPREVAAIVERDLGQPRDVQLVAVLVIRLRAARHDRRRLAPATCHPGRQLRLRVGQGPLEMSTEFTTIPLDHALRVLEMRPQVCGPVRRRRSHLQRVRVHARRGRAACVALDPARLREQARKEVGIHCQCRLDRFVFSSSVVALPTGRSQRQQQNHEVGRGNFAGGTQQFQRAADVATLQRVEPEAEECLRMPGLQAPDFVPVALRLLEPAGRCRFVGSLYELRDRLGHGGSKKNGGPKPAV